MQKFKVMLLAALWLLVAGWPLFSVAETADCRQLAAPISGEERKYSVVADIYGIRVYPDIACAVYWRTTQLCATELSTFQFTAKVFDYHSGDEVLMTEAYYVVAAPGESRPLAFASRDGAQKFVAAAGGGELLSHEELLSYPF
ncbi:hypothetical protein [Desulfurivibrio alkaliphilus]|uniref:Uncharacterized protein n=1 Tax=Desulfurivibrio alkaliphilus (strain DSM 19089 / UNIQEM U267 / AHT2) TaxID=589865 RepID=D6Z3T5_DESAT|nr:hypothetical protein [Desulfurivibrio alkaliphilus]ADH86210.1 hypothetical protein DaAHT2_1515 [Desulfurivibrio alkaliphilus AHT 2]